MKAKLRIKKSECCECEKEELKDYECHFCHDGRDVDSEFHDNWKIVYLNDSGLLREENWMFQCPKCDVEYYNYSKVGDGGAGGEEYKILPDDTRIEKYKPRKNYNEPLRCNY